MSNKPGLIAWILGACITAVTALAQAPPCPDFNPNKVNLACQIPVALGISTPGSHTLAFLSPTLTAQFSQLPAFSGTGDVVSGTGLTFSSSGILTATTESLGTILSRRGDTIGRYKWLVSLSFQHIKFDSVDGMSLKHLNTVDQVNFSSGATVFREATNRIDLTMNQFTAGGTLGVTSRIDLSVLVPFAKVTLKTGSAGREFDFNSSSMLTNISPANSFLSGSATGIGDVAVNLKLNVFRGEHAKISLGTTVRFPTGDETNLLGTGAYGFGPYVVFSRSGRITPNFNLGYQWNGSSALFMSPTTNRSQPLPSALLYSGGMDFKVMKNLTLVGEFIGQYVLDGPRLIGTSKTIPSLGTAQSVDPGSSSYAMDNIGLGLKANPFKGLVITGDVIVPLDNGGLRSRILPLLGLSYRFPR